jgi:RNA polymerase sigma-70 factor (ECF subfamily)
MPVAERSLDICLERGDAASDLELCAWCRAGSATAFSQLAERYQAPLRLYCARLVGRDHAEDVVQQGLVKAWLALSRDSAQVDNPKGWLYRIVHNQAMDQLRTCRTRWEELDPDWEADHSTEQTCELRDRLGRVSVAINELPGRQREALLMHTVDGHTYQDIASAMDTNVPAVSQLITRARARLRDIPAVLLPTSALSRLGRAVARGPSLSPAAKAAVLTTAVCAGAGIPVVANHREPRRPSAAAPSSASAGAINRGSATANADGRELSFHQRKGRTPALIVGPRATLESSISAPSKQSSRGSLADPAATTAHSDAGGTHSGGGNQSGVHAGIQLGSGGSGASVSADAGIVNANVSAGSSGVGGSVSIHPPDETPPPVQSLTQSVGHSLP